MRASAVGEVDVAVDLALVEPQAAGLDGFESPEPAVARDGPVVVPAGLLPWFASWAFTVECSVSGSGRRLWYAEMASTNRS